MPDNQLSSIAGKHHTINVKFTLQTVEFLSSSIIVSWLYALLVVSGDVHPHQGLLSAYMSSSHLSALNLSSHLSLVHCNVQSIIPKLDVLSTELFDFDVLSFSETWLNPSVSSNDLHIQPFNKPERKDRVGDSHGGVLIYVKENMHYRRRHNLEILGLKNIWIELSFKHKRELFGVFYRPPNSGQLYDNSLEVSIHLAINTGINNMIITGDFNFNTLNSQSARKIQSLSQQFSLRQCISEPTHFTEHSSSLIDLLQLTKPNHLFFCGVGDPFLQQDVRYHCLIYGIFNFAKPKQKSYTRHICKYDQGDYVTLKKYG